MTRIFMTGLEGGSTGVFDVVERVTASSSQARTGSYSLAITRTDSRAIIHLPSRNELYVRFGIYPTGGLYDYHRVFFTLMFGGTVQLQLHTPGEQLAPITLTRGDYSGTVLATGGGFALNAWHCVEMYAKIADVDGRAVVRIDGTDVIDYTGDTQNASKSDITAVCFGYATAEGRVMYAYVDDIAINDTNGTTNNSWIGRGGIYPAIVDGAGEHAEFTPASGNNWENVDEIPPDDDTSYVESDTLGHRDLYTIDSITPTSGTITAVQWMARAKMVDAGIGNLQRLVRHDSVDYAGADKPVDTSYRYLTDIMELAPDDTAWTVAKVNALQIGQKVN
jgi:hypothetical protein